MNTGNLIPEYRLIARRRRRCIRRWFGGCVGYAFFLVLAFPFASLVWVQDKSLDAQLMTIRQEVSDSELHLKREESELEDAQTTLKATKLVENQSDWSILLAVLAGEVGDDIVLKTCKVEPMKSDDEAAAGSRAGSPLRSLGGAIAAQAEDDDKSPIHVEADQFLIELHGYGLTQRAVSHFVLRLERTGLFEMVTLKKTRREPFMKDNAIAFQLKCYLKGENRGGGA